MSLSMLGVSAGWALILAVLWLSPSSWLLLSHAASPLSGSLTPEAISSMLTTNYAPPQLTVRYAPGTEVEAMLTHIRRIEAELGGSFSPPTSHIVFTGFFTTGITLELMLPFQQLLPGILSITPSRKFRCTGTMNWGLDRINSYSMPSADFSFTPDFTGEGVDVYIVDSGMDSSHEEFRGNPRRIVANVYDPRFSSFKNIPLNNDEVGHGTHIAGIVGGRTVGVAPSANLLGVRVMDASGEGYDSDIIWGLQFVYDLFVARKKPPSVINMSLGGPCGSHDDCVNDAIVQAVEALSSEGIAVVVAAGNSECDACLETPAFAPSAVTVGASDRQDRAAVFSDFGKCVDVFAPGEDIVSACSAYMCGATNSYVALSGTSMATPFVTGTMAQIFQAVPDIGNRIAVDMLGCLAGKGLLDVVQDEAPSVTRNLLLQSPRRGNLANAVCDLGAGCPSSCSSHGLCQAGSCLCDSGWWGDACHTQDFGSHCGDGLVFVRYELFDVQMSGWGSAELRVVGHRDGGVVPVLSTSMCAGRNESSGMCLEPRKQYSLSVSADVSATSHIGYRICGQFGGGPSTQSFVVAEDASCSFICTQFEYVVLSQGTNILADGLHGGHYQLFDRNTGSIIAGGTLVGFARIETHPICMPAATDSLVVIVSGSTISGVGNWQFCDRSGPVVDDFAVYSLTRDECRYTSPFTQGGIREFPIGEFNSYSLPWDGYVDVRVNIISSLTSYDASKSFSVGQGVLTRGFMNQSSYVIPSSSSNWHLISASDNVTAAKFWISCGARGLLGESFKFASNGAGCTRECLNFNALAPLSTGDATLVTVTSGEFPFDLSEIRVFPKSSSLCLGDSFSPQSLQRYRLIVGAGTLVSSPSWTLCGKRFPSNAVIDIYVRDWTECSANVTYVPQCKTKYSGMLMVLYSAGGDGWAESEYLVYDISTLMSLSNEDSSSLNDDYAYDDDAAGSSTILVDSSVSSESNATSTASSRYISRGTLGVGYTGYGSFCVPDGCYALVVTSGSHSSSIAWLLCGHVGQAGETFFFRVRSPFHLNCLLG